MTEQTYQGAWNAAVDFLTAAGVETIFGLPGDDLGMLRALQPTDRRIVLCRDQRNAIFMATGFALQSGKPGIAVIGKGPAAANAVTGLLEAHCSAAPVVVLAGGTSVEQRGSNAFQELDQLALVAPLTKWAHRVDHPDRVAAALEKALLIATSGTPGPVYLEFPDHLLKEEINRTRPWHTPADVTRVDHAVTAVDGAALAAIKAAKHPLILVGGGMRHRNADGVVERFAETIGAGIYSTATGRSTVDENHAQFCGLAGLYSPQQTAELWSGTDLLITLGSRLEETATFGWEGIGTSVPVLQVNIDAGGLSVEFAGPKVIGDGAGTVSAWLTALAGHTPDADWVATISRCRSEAAAAAQARLKVFGEDAYVHVAEVLAAIDTVAPESRILVQENGLQDMWSYIYPYYSCGARGGSVVPSEQTTLGFGAAAAAGVKIAAPDRPVIAFVGDGAFNLFRSDLETLGREGIGVVYVVLRNGGYGWLQSQLDQHGLPADRYPFVSGELAAAAHATPPRVEQVVISDKAALAEGLGRAVTASLEGRVTVVHVPVELSDAPPGISDLEGDFPGGNDKAAH
ncbi:thiamine pyrophosphate-binding protein [Crossiella sp. CA198]|uniref:thiamine pyrophosphate-binding protein n=1 Tax=Crossiella sp. CA198 TaxID=3455607 RepID=UPI003F8D0157